MARRKTKKLKTKKAASKKKPKVKKTKKINFIPKGFHTATPYLTVHDGKAAIAFYTKAFGAREKPGRMTGSDGKILHTEFRIGDSHFMLADEFPEWGNVSPKTLGKSPVQFNLYFKNCDSVMANAVAAGGRNTMAIADQFYGDRSGRLEDPFGYTWHIATHFEDVSPKEMAKRAEKLYGAG